VLAELFIPDTQVTAHKQHLLKQQAESTARQEEIEQMRNELVCIHAQRASRFVTNQSARNTHLPWCGGFLQDEALARQGGLQRPRHFKPPEMVDIKELRPDKVLRAYAQQGRGQQGGQQGSSSLLDHGQEGTDPGARRK
jgi:hypothetical protein